MKRYEIPRAVEIGQAAEIVLDHKVIWAEDCVVGAQPYYLRPCHSIVDFDE